MMQGNLRSKIVHYESCRFNGKIFEKNLVELNDIEQAKAMGFRNCHCCTPILKATRLNAKPIKEFCKNNWIDCSLDNDKVHIKSVGGEWIYGVSPENKGILYHRNTCGDTNAYHNQNCNEDRFLGVLRYIVKHDEYRAKNPVSDTVKLRFHFMNINETVTVDSIIDYLYQGKSKRPQKGGKKYKNIVKHVKAQKRKLEINRVLSLIEGLSTAYSY